jgi:condensin complex subunit 3
MQDKRAEAELANYNPDNANLQAEDDEMSSLPETPSSRLTTHILNLLLSVITAKDKVVRFRVNQMISHVINSLGHIDTDLYNLIKLSLSRRLRDKESSVRQQAVLGFGSLAGGEDDDDDDDSDDESPVGGLKKQLNLLKHDPSAEVRRAVLMNLSFTPTSLKHMLERARDVDPVTRRALYSKLIPALGDFRHLSLVEREKLIRWGLRDRDELVRKAAARLFRERWLEACVLPPSMEALTELLERIDVTTHSGIEGGIAHEAMAAFWEGRPDYRDFITFDDDFWNDLTAEGAFIARSFNDYCIAAKDEILLEQKMPEVTKIAFFISKYLNHLIQARKQIAELDDLSQGQEEAYAELEFTAEQLLHIALTLDYSDEVGRRQVFNLMREALALPELPEECTTLAVQVLRRVCRESGEKEFISVMKEALDEVKASTHDTDFEEGEGEDDDEEESFHSAQSDISDLSSDAAQARKMKKKKGTKPQDVEKDEDQKHIETLTYAKCMHLAECLLQNIDCPLESSNVLVDLLNVLIVPAVKLHNDIIREMGIKCLGLCALRSKVGTRKPICSSNYLIYFEILRTWQSATCYSLSTAP